MLWLWGWWGHDGGGAQGVSVVSGAAGAFGRGLDGMLGMGWVESGWGSVGCGGGVGWVGSTTV